MKKLLFTALIVLALALSVMSPALAVVEQSDAYYVADYAGVLSDGIEQKIISSNADLEQKCNGAQIVVVTVQYLDGMYADEYATTLFNNWGVGDENANNGMLLLLATGENKAWLSVGAGISGSFSDNKVDDYFNRYFWDEFDKGNYETATSDMLEALFSWYADFYNVDSSQPNGANGNVVNDSPVDNGISVSDTIMAWFIILSIFFLIVVLPIIVIIVKISSDKRRYRNYYSNLGTPAPTYHFWYRWGGRPHNAWWYGPDGPGWNSRPRGGYYYNGQNRSFNNGSSNTDSGGFGGFSAGSSGGSQGRGRGGGGFAGGGGGRGGSGNSSGSSSSGNHAHSSGSSNSGGFGGFGSGSRSSGSGGFGGFGGGSSSRSGGGRSSSGGGGRSSGGGGGRR
jgi:uncharacterized protein